MTLGDDTYWKQLHDLYSDKAWVHKPSLFAEEVARVIPSSGMLLDLGAGLGQDSMYFSQLGFKVTATDLNVTKLLELNNSSIASIEPLDLRNKMPYAGNSFDVVYAHLSLHYFDDRTTTAIFDEIHRILKPSGHLAFFVNSTSDPECGSGVKIERHFYDIDGTLKRYFDVEDAKGYAHAFEAIVADNKGETYKDREKGVYNLVRFIGRK